MNFLKAKSYVMDRLANELPSYCHYHSLAHTNAVLAASEVLASGESIVDPEILELIRTAAVFHDCGFIEKYDQNEIIAARIAGEVLPSMEYSATQIEFVQRLIIATTLGKVPSDGFEQLIKDADFSYLGKAGYFEISLRLKEEWQAVGRSFTLKEWHELQVRFLEQHRFYTETAKRLYQPLKEKQLLELKELLPKIK